MSDAPRHARYTPGRLVLMAGASCWLLAEVDPAAPIVAEVMGLIGRAASVDDILDAVGRNGLRTLPRFALVHVDSDVTVAIVRGDIEAGVLAADDRLLTELSGMGARSWHEASVSREAAAIQLGVPIAVADQPAAPTLPLHSGVVLASTVRIVLSESDTVATPAPVMPTVTQAVVAPSTPAPVSVTSGRAELGVVASTEEGADDSAAVGLTASYKDPSYDEAAANVVGEGGTAIEKEASAEEPSADGDGTPYDHLFEATQRRTVEDAAVRPIAPPAPAPAAPVPASVPASKPAPVPLAPAASGAPSAPAAPSAPLAPAPAAAPNGMIDGVPWLAKPAQPEPIAPTFAPAPLSFTPAPAVPPRAPSAPTAPPPTAPAPTARPRPPSIPPDPEDDDGTTVSRAHLRSMLDAGGQASTADGFAVPVVHAVSCGSGHLNPPHSTRCRVCDAAIDSVDPFTVPRPPLGVLRLSTGDVVTLDRGVVMGRSPRTDWPGATDRPHVVRLPSPTQDISRTHLQITLDGWHVLVADLDSTNGTLVTVPGQRPQRLRPNEPTPIPPGTFVALSDAINFRYEAVE